RRELGMILCSQATHVRRHRLRILPAPPLRVGEPVDGNRPWHDFNGEGARVGRVPWRQFLPGGDYNSARKVCCSRLRRVLQPAAPLTIANGTQQPRGGPLHLPRAVCIRCGGTIVVDYHERVLRLKQEPLGEVRRAGKSGGKTTPFEPRAKELLLENGQFG